MRIMQILAPLLLLSLVLLYFKPALVLTLVASTLLCFVGFLAGILSPLHARLDARVGAVSGLAAITLTLIITTAATTITANATTGTATGTAKATAGSAAFVYDNVFSAPPTLLLLLPLLLLLQLLLSARAGASCRPLGLTGGIATGKSTATRFLRSVVGVTVIDADVVAHQAVQVGTWGHARVVSAFSKENILLKDGSGAIDRARLRTIVFNCKHKRRKLNAATRPVIALHLLWNLIYHGLIAPCYKECIHQGAKFKLNQNDLLNIHRKRKGQQLVGQQLGQQHQVQLQEDKKSRRKKVISCPSSSSPFSSLLSPSSLTSSSMDSFTSSSSSSSSSSSIASAPDASAPTAGAAAAAVADGGVGGVSNCGGIGSGIVVLDAALLYESSLHYICRRVWVVGCEVDTQLRRLCARDSVTKDAARAAIAAQMPFEEKKKRANVTLWNDGASVEEFAQSVKIALAEEMNY